MGRLSAEQRAHYDRWGFVAPFPLLEPAEIHPLMVAGARFRARRAPGLQRFHHRRVQTLEGAEREAFYMSSELPWVKSAHAYEPAIFDLVNRPRLVAIAQELLSEAVVAWGAYAIKKDPGVSHRWHVDIETLHFRSVNVWLALANTEWCRLKLIAGSQDLPAPQNLARGGALDLENDAQVWAAARGLGHDVELIELSPPPGHCVVFHGRLWHAAFTNDDAPAPRESLLVQYSPSSETARIPVTFDDPVHWHPVPPPCVLVSGDSAGDNRIVERPTETGPVAPDG